jgi:rare lipoprotein A
MDRFKVIILFLCACLISACSASSERYQIKNDHSPSEIPPLAHIENVTPRYEPYSRGGNKNYTVRGTNYKVLKGVTKYTESGNASWYGNKFHGHLTANGERYNMFAMSAAHKNLPLPSYVQVTNLENNKQIIVRVNDRGPFHEGRIIDLSYAAAYKLDMLKSGTGKVKIELLHFPEKENKANQFNGSYYIQYMVSSAQQKAELLAEKLSEKYHAKSFFIEENNRYKLRLGPFNSQLTAQNLLAKIQQDYPGAFIIHQK